MTRRHLRNFICATAAVLALVGIFGEHLRAYTLLGYKWSTNQVLYYVNAQNNYLSDAVATAAIQSAASAWTAQTGANFQFVYAGTTSGSSFTDNHKNEVFFRTDSTSPGGETYWWADANGNLVDADISFNQGRYVFTADGLPCSGAIPLQDFATHEFGHALGLRHSGAVDATMYANFPGWCDTSWRSLSSDDISGIQAMYSGGPAPTIPTAPSSLTVSRNASSPTSTLYLAWTDRSSNEDGFRIERSLDGLVYLKVTDVAMNVTSFTDQGLLPGIQYYYRVAAYNGVGTSSYSNSASAFTDQLLSGGDSLTLSVQAVKVRKSNKANLTWSGFTSTNVDVYRNGTKLTTTANDGAYTDSVRLLGIYLYKVCQAGSSSVCTATVSVTF